MSRKLTFKRFETPFELTKYVNEWGIRQEDIQQITGTDNGILEKNNFTLFYWH